jgi:Acetyltransferase (GNAT) domain
MISTSHRSRNAKTLNPPAHGPNGPCHRAVAMQRRLRPERHEGVGVITVRCEPSAEQAAWDERAASLGGSFFHCHAYALSESVRPGSTPLFVTALDRAGECVGVAVGSVSTPRHWPSSRFCKTAVFGALPATREDSPELQRSVLAAIEETLRREGVFSIHVHSYESPHAAAVLPALSYRLIGRCEFYLDLSRPIEDIWKAFRGSRRTDIRKARKLGVETKAEHTVEVLEELIKLQKGSYQRHGVDYVTDGHYCAAKRMLIESGRTVLLASYRGGVMLNAALFGLFGGRAHYLNAGSSAEGNRRCGPSHLIWTMIEVLKARGYSSLDLGGVPLRPGEPEDENGLYNFKRDFGATAAVQPSGVKVLSHHGSWLHRGMRVLARVARRGRSCRVTAHGSTAA